jgi:hypothetical protein
MRAQEEKQYQGNRIYSGFSTHPMFNRHSARSVAAWQNPLQAARQRQILDPATSRRIEALANPG